MHFPGICIRYEHFGILIFRNHLGVSIAQGFGPPMHKLLVLNINRIVYSPILARIE